MAERQRRFGIAGATSAAMLLLLGLAEGYIWLVLSPADQQSAVERWRAGQSSRAEVRRLALDRWLSQGRHDAAMAAAFPTVIEAITTANAGRSLSDAQRVHLREILQVVGRRKELAAVTLLDRRGQPVGSEGVPCQHAACGRPAAAVLADGHARTELTDDHTAFLYPVVRSDQQPPVGVVVVLEALDAWLRPFLERGRRGAEEQVLLTQWEGSHASAQLPRGAPGVHLATSPLPGPFLPAPSAAPSNASGHEAWYRDGSGSLALTAVRRLNEGRWTLALAIGEDDILGPVRRHTAELAAEAAALLGLMWLAAAALSYAVQRSHESRLARQRAALATLFEQANDAILVSDPDGRVIEANHRAEELYGRTRAELLSMEIGDLQPAESREGAVEKWLQAGASGQRVFEADHLGREGRRIPVEISRRRVRWEEAEAVVAIVRDVGERRQAEAQILRLNRLLRTLFEARAVVLRAPDREALLQGVCRALADEGVAPLAWIGWLDEASREVRPVAGAGVALDYLHDLSVPLEPPGPGGPIARALREGRASVCQDVLDDPDSGPWRAIQIEQGFRAVGAFPVVVDGLAVAVLAVCLRERQAFGDEEVRLFGSLAADLGLALTTLEREAERRSAAEALRASEARYRLLAENAADVIWTLDLASMRFTYVSPSITRLRGLAPEDLMGQPLGAALGPDDTRHYAEELHSVLAALEAGDESQRVQVREVEQVRRDGSAVWVEVVTTLLNDASGHPATVLGVSRDVTGRHRAEETLRERTTLLEAILDSPAQAVFALDRELRYTGFNEVHAQATREVYGTQIARGQGVLEAITQESDRARAEDCCRRALAGEAVVDEAVWGEPQRGQRLFEVSYNPIRADGGQIAGVAVFALDVTERRQAEARLRQLWQAVEQSPVVVVITDPQGVVEYVNPRFSVVTGYTAAEAVGARVSLLKSNQTPPEVYAELWATITAGGVWHGEFLNRRKDGGLFWEAAAISPVRDAAGRVTHYLAVKEDVTERKHAAQALAETQQLLAQAQKMEAVGRLAGGVAHDFNNLLGVIRGHAELLRRQISEDHPGLRRIEQVLRSCDRAADLSRQLLAFGRKQTLRMQVLQLEQVVGEAEKMLRRLIGEDIDLRVVVPAGLPPVKADPVQIEQVLLNLAVNARDAMPDGGAVTIELARLDATTAAAEGLPPAEHVAMIVTDTGCGMDAETLVHVFEPFFTTKETGKGTGLGLATVYGVVTQLGGQVRVESRLGVGSAFRVYLPAELEAPVTAVPPVSAGPAVQGRAETILLVEDEAGLREVLTDQLTVLGYRVLATGRPAEALAVARQHQAPIELLLTDVVMPGGNGRELARTLQAERPGLRVLLMSGYSADALDRPIDTALRLLDKPFTLQQLAAALREVLS